MQKQMWTCKQTRYYKMQIKIHAPTIEQANLLYDLINATCCDMVADTVGYDPMIDQGYILMQPRTTQELSEHVDA